MGKKIIFSKEQIKEIIKMYNDGISMVKIAEQFNCSNKTIGRLLKKENIKSRGNRKIFFNEEIFNNIDNAEKAYWIGFITADGYINEDRGFLSIKLQYDDIEHLKKFAKFIGCSEENIVTEYHNITGKPLCRICLNSRKLVDSLVNLNIRQNKSTDEHVTSIPNKFIRDYIRGIIDGDGHIDKKRIDICNSIEVLTYIKNYLNEKCYTTIGKICNHCNTYRIFICKNREIALKFLYYDNCICLNRKYDFIKENYFNNTQKEKIVIIYK